jgi:hypothetical protein
MLKNFIFLITFVLLLVIVPMNVFATEYSQYDELSSSFEQNIISYDLVIYSDECCIIPTYIDFLYTPYSSFTFTIMYSYDITLDGTIEELCDVRLLGSNTVIVANIISPIRCVARYGWPTTVQFNNHLFFSRGEIITGSRHIGGIATCVVCGSEALVSGVVNRVVGEFIIVEPNGYWVLFRGSLFVERPLRSAVAECYDGCC